jgi:hypothetical protein
VIRRMKAQDSPSSRYQVTIPIIRQSWEYPNLIKARV